MSAMHEFSKDTVVDSPLGKKKVDSEGAPISGFRMDVFKAYAGVPGLLQKVINVIEYCLRYIEGRAGCGFAGSYSGFLRLVVYAAGRDL